MTTLRRESNYYNPFFIEDREVLNIYFYNADGILCDSGRAWLGSNNGRATLPTGEIVRKAKINTGAACNFWIPAQGPDYKRGKFCNVYLFADGERIKCERLPDTESDGLRKTTRERWKNFKVTIQGESWTITKHAESVRTEFGRVVDQLEADFKNAGITVDGYNVIKIAESFNISKKEV